jgi:serine protein kinase
VKEEYEDIIKGEVQRAISADEDAIRRLCANYIENVQGLHAEGAGQEPLHGTRTRSRTSG